MWSLETMRVRTVGKREDSIELIMEIPFWRLRRIRKKKERKKKKRKKEKKRNCRMTSDTS